MKKVLSIIFCLLCVTAAYAVSYASPYRGGYSSGQRYTTSAAYRQVSMATAPVATMRSTGMVSPSGGRGTTPSMSGAVAVQPVRGIYTSASAVRGGMTAGQTYGRMNAPGIRKTPGGGGGSGGGDIENLPDCGCYWYFDEEAGVWKCVNCDCTISEDDLLDGKLDHCDCDPCNCPIGDGWEVWLFMAVLAVGYVAYRKRDTDATETSVMRTRCVRE